MSRERPGEDPGGSLQVLAAALLFSTGSAAVKATALGDLQVASLRSGLAALTVAALVPLLGGPRPRIGWRTWLVGAAYAATLTLSVAANKRTTAASAIFLESTAPLYVLLLGPWLLKERLRLRDLAYLAAMVLGLVAVLAGVPPVYATAPEPLAGNLLGALGGVTWALTVVGLRWVGRRSGGGAGADLGAVICGNLLAFAAGLPWVLPLGPAAPIDVAVVVYLGVFQVAVAYLFLTAGIRRVPALEASLLLLLYPALSPLWAWLLHGERPGLWALAGGAVVVLATLVRTWARARSGVDSRQGRYYRGPRGPAP